MLLGSVQAVHTSRLSENPVVGFNNGLGSQAARGWKDLAGWYMFFGVGDERLERGMIALIASVLPLYLPLWVWMVTAKTFASIGRFSQMFLLAASLLIGCPARNAGAFCFAAAIWGALRSIFLRDSRFSWINPPAFVLLAFGLLGDSGLLGCA